MKKNNLNMETLVKTLVATKENRNYKTVAMQLHRLEVATKKMLDVYNAASSNAISYRNGNRDATERPVIVKEAINDGAVLEAARSLRKALLDLQSTCREVLGQNFLNSFVKEDDIETISLIAEEYRSFVI